MPDVTILDNEYITIKYMPDKKLIYHKVHQPLSGQPFREALVLGYDALQHYGCTKWVSDDRLNGPMSDEDRAWGEVNLTRRSIEMGWKYWALIVPQQLVAAGTMQPTMEALHDFGLRMMVFSDEESAFAWIAQFED